MTSQPHRDLWRRFYATSRSWFDPFLASRDEPAHVKSSVCGCGEVKVRVLSGSDDATGGTGLRAERRGGRGSGVGRGDLV